MSDDEAIDFSHASVAEQRIRLALQDIDVSRLEFDRWRVANGHDPEWAASDRQPTAPRCTCNLCKTDIAPAGEPITIGD